MGCPQGAAAMVQAQCSLGTSLPQPWPIDRDRLRGQPVSRHSDVGEKAALHVAGKRLGGFRRLRPLLAGMDQCRRRATKGHMFAIAVVVGP